MYLVEQADDDKDGMVISYNMHGFVFSLFVSVVTARNFESQQSLRWKQSG